MFTPNVSQIPATMAAAPKLLAAGQARAQRLIDRIEAQTKGSAILEIGALRAMVRNLCAEVAAFDNEDGSVEVEFKGLRMGVLLTGDLAALIQVAGVDIEPLLSDADVSAIVTLAQEVQRQQWIDDAAEVRFRARGAA